MKKLITCLMAGLLCMGMAGCSSSAGDKAYPITVDGTDIIVGETTVGTLIDAGFTIEQGGYSDDNEVPADTMLEKNSYYSGLYLHKGETKYCTLSFVTDRSDVPLTDAVIAKVIIYNDSYYLLDETMFDGVNLTEITPEIAKEHIAGAKVSEDNSSVYLSGSKYFVDVNFDENGLSNIEMKRKYDVDYTS